MCPVTNCCDVGEINRTHANLVELHSTVDNTWIIKHATHYRLGKEMSKSTCHDARLNNNHVRVRVNEHTNTPIYGSKQFCCLDNEENIWLTAAFEDPGANLSIFLQCVNTSKRFSSRSQGLTVVFAPACTPNSFPWRTCTHDPDPS